MVVYSSIIYIQGETMNGIRQDDKLFNNAKTNFFSRIALAHKDILKIHKERLWEKTQDNKRDWWNVSEHCLVVAARCVAIAEKIGLSQETITHLEKAALVHDALKKVEKETVEGNPTWEKFRLAWKREDQILWEYDISQEVQAIRWGSGHESLRKTQEILDKSKKWPISDSEKAFLILHYVDDYTVNDTWVVPGDDQLQKRVDFNRANPRYKQLDEEGREYFDGDTTFDVQLQVGRRVEDWLLWELENQGLTKTTEISYFIDSYIKEKISWILN